jgi:hypothetical protein
MKSEEILQKVTKATKEYRFSVYGASGVGTPFVSFVVFCKILCFSFV